MLRISILTLLLSVCLPTCQQVALTYSEVQVAVYVFDAGVATPLRLTSIT